MAEKKSLNQKMEYTEGMIIALEHLASRGGFQYLVLVGAKMTHLRELEM